MNNFRDIAVLYCFGKRLVYLRKLKNISQKDLAYIMEVEISQVYRIEKGKINPTLTTIILISAALKIELKDLFDY